MILWMSLWAMSLWMISDIQVDTAMQTLET